MSKFSSIALGVVGAGMVVVAPALAQGLIVPTNTRSPDAIPTATVPVSSTDQPSSGTIDGRKQSPLLVPTDSPG